MRPRYSLLHLQMGQEVVYLILTVAVAASLILATFLVFQQSRIIKYEFESVELTNLHEKMAAATDELAITREALARADNSVVELRNALYEKLAYERRIKDLSQQIDSLKKALGDVSHDKPPIISLSEANGYYFRSGSAELEPDFHRKLITEIIPILLREGARYRVDVIEVIGHTDETPVRQKNQSILDAALLPFLRGDIAAQTPVGLDNVGLGMARAAAVARVLLSDGRLKNRAILPLSAGQTTTVDGKLAPGHFKGADTDERERRRIEIRLRRS